MADWRTTRSFLPNRKAEQQEIYERHRAGRHYIGDWHTHYEEMPRPSATDIRSIRECFARSEHDLLGFVLVVVGRCNPPRGLHVSLHGEANGVELVARPETDARTAGARARGNGPGHTPTQ
ncbi:MAG: Mov34/MPN/PAD-1 family protein [Planctomycetes bacterium]|nr:Mov34/MPN/PAD-1 family protein [Planctomycetota bacterium]